MTTETPKRTDSELRALASTFCLIWDTSREIDSSLFWRSPVWPELFPFSWFWRITIIESFLDESAEMTEFWLFKSWISMSFSWSFWSSVYLYFSLSESFIFSKSISDYGCSFLSKSALTLGCKTRLWTCSHPNLLKRPCSWLWKMYL